MSDSEKHAAEVSKGTDDIQMDPPRMKIRIRLPPRKRLSNGLLKAEKEAPRGTSNAQNNRVPAPTKIKIPIKKLTITAAQRYTGRISTRGLCNKSHNNNLSRTPPNEPYCDTSSKNLPEEANGSPSKNLTFTADTSSDNLPEEANGSPRKNLTITADTSSDRLPEEANGSPSKNLTITCDTSSNRLPEKVNGSPSKNLTVTAGVCGNSVSNYSANELLSEEANDNIPSKPHPAPIKELASKPLESMPRKNLTTMGVLDEEENSNSLRLFHETDNNIPSKNLTITAGVCGNYVSHSLKEVPSEEEANDNIPTKPHTASIKELPAKPLDNMPIKNLTTMGVLGEEGNDNSLKLFHETDNKMPNKVVLQEISKNNQSRNLTTTAVKCEEANNDSLSKRLSEDANNNIPTRKLFYKTKNNTQCNRPTDPDRKNPQKKLSTSAVHAAHARQNTCAMKRANSAMKPSTSFGQAAEQGINKANLEAIKQYQEFEEKVKRTVYLDCFSHQATEAVIKTALNQFGAIREINFLVNYTIPFSIPQSALVIMETEKDAVAVVNMLNEFPFMMSGMPRPVRATRATAEMFNDRPRRPGSKSEFRWVSSTDADYHIVKKLKLMSRRHELENLALIKHELEEENFLAKHQEEILNCNQRKLEVVDSVMLSGKFNHLSHIYSINVDEVFCKWLV